MTRVKRGFVARKRRKKILNLAEGFRGASSVLFRTANQQTMKALRYSYRDRNQRKRQFRSLWITRIHAQIQETCETSLYDLNYNQFINGLKRSHVILNRKVLAQLAVYDSESFGSLIKDCFWDRIFRDSLSKF
jgi:large subunit ribosomal protein L20